MTGWKGWAAEEDAMLSIGLVVWTDRRMRSRCLCVGLVGWLDWGIDAMRL